MDSNQKVDKNTFIKHMFEDDNVKPSIFNIIQYAATGVIPLIILNRFMQHLFPEVDERKNNLELGVEIIGQLTLLFVGIFFIDKFVRYFKAYSGEKYEDVSVLSMILPLMIILISVPSKLGDKIKIIMERVLRSLNIESEKPRDDEYHEEEEHVTITPTFNTVQNQHIMKPTLEPERTRKVPESGSTLISQLHNDSGSSGRVSNGSSSMGTLKVDPDSYMGSQFSAF